MAIRDVIWNGNTFVNVDADTLDGKDSVDFGLKKHPHVVSDITNLLNATQTQDGLLSKADKTKLDGLSVAQWQNFYLELLRNNDLNNIVAPGKYRARTDSDVTSIANRPPGVSVGFDLEVDELSPGRINQKLFARNNIMFTRTRDDNNTWTTWVKMYSSSQKPTLDELGYKIPTAAQVGAIPTSASCNKNWNWSGQPGQPTWLWGGNEASTMYVYNPANFNVASANTAKHLVMASNNYGSPIEIGQYIDFHKINSSADYDVRLYIDGTNLITTGTFQATKVFNAVWNDYAELFEKEANDLSAGDLLAWNDYGVVKATERNKQTVVGVYSDTYGHLLGGKDKTSEEDNLKEYAPVGLSGRVYVKVSGTINKGDFIVPSNIPGVGKATKQYQPGCVVGKSLESYDGVETKRIQMLIMNI